MNFQIQDCEMWPTETEDVVQWYRAEHISTSRTRCDSWMWQALNYGARSRAFTCLFCVRLCVLVTSVRVYEQQLCTLPLFSILVPSRWTGDGSSNSTESPLLCRRYERWVNGGAFDAGHNRPVTWPGRLMTTSSGVQLDDVT